MISFKKTDLIYLGQTQFIPPGLQLGAFSEVKVALEALCRAFTFVFTNIICLFTHNIK